MIVMHQISPRTPKPIARNNPPKIIHIIFAIGCFPKSFFTCVPKGQKASLASLKLCLPNGIPIMVIHQMSPVKNHAIPVQRPVKRNHKMLPSVFIILSFVN